MYLLIDPSTQNAIHLALFGTGGGEWFHFEGKNRLLLETIDTLLTQEHLDASRIHGIAVVVGVGSFTSTRIAVTVANTFAYAKDIPVLAVQEKEKEDFANIATKLTKATPGVYISATYSGEPNIGKKRT